MRETGCYEHTIPKAWAKLFAWLDANGLYQTMGRGYGLAWDNPLKIGHQNCRYDACVEIRPEHESKALRELDVTTLPAGAYACQRLSGNYDGVRSAVAGVYSQFRPLPGLCVDGRRPVVSIYIDHPGRGASYDLRSDICVPVIADEECLCPRLAASA
jgi:AraC family transcriptional regulator